MAPVRSRNQTEAGKELAIKNAVKRIKRTAAAIRRNTGAAHAEVDGGRAVSEATKQKLFKEVTKHPVDEVIGELEELESKLESTEYEKLNEELKKLKIFVTATVEAITKAEKEEDNGEEGDRNDDEETESSEDEEESVALKAVIHGLESMRLPAIEPDVFDGDVLSFFLWETQVDLMLNKKHLTTSEKMMMLRRYLSGDALQAVDALFMLPGDKYSYAEIRKTLTARFGHTHLVCEAFRRKLDRWPRISGAKDLQMFADFLHQCSVAKRSQPGLGVLDDPHEIMKIADKLPSGLGNRGDRVAAGTSISARHPDFRKMADFVIEEARIANSPYARTPQPERANNTPTRKATTRVVDSQTTEEVGCKFCDKGDHATVECKRLGDLDSKEQGDFVRKKGLCWRCLQWGHVAKDCNYRPKCGRCEGTHPTSLHGRKRGTDEAESQRLVATDHVAGQQHARGRLPAAGGGHRVGRAHARVQPEPHESEADLCHVLGAMC